MRSIAASLERAPSTISREIRRNGGADGYRANKADQAARQQAHRPKPCTLAQNRELARIVAQKLTLLWSPEQIAQAKLNAVARQLNERPRKTLNYETPAERFSQCVALTS